MTFNCGSIAATIPVAAASLAASKPGEIKTAGSDDTNALSLSLYRVTFVARERLDLPAYLGSTLRGAFGHVFRALACPGRFDQPCPIPASCPYHLIFETSPPPDSQALRTHDEIPRPFVIAPITNGNAGWLEHGRRLIEPGSELSFDLTLIGRAQEFFPYFVVALREIDRLGRQRKTGDVFENHPAAGTQQPEPTANDNFRRRASRPPGLEGTESSQLFENHPAADTQQPEPTANDNSRRRASRPPGLEGTENSQLFENHRAADTQQPEPTANDNSRRRASRPVELRRIDLLDPLSDAAWPVYDAADNLVRPLRKPLTLSECAAIPPPTSGHLTLDFLTQTRLKHEGGWARVPEFQIVFRRLLGRLSSMARFHCGAPLEVDFRDLIQRAGEVRLIDNQTRWVSWTRYSSRQGRRMDWEGLIGRATYQGDFAPFWPYLLFGQWTHLGRGATFGLGRYIKN